jgi:hypothetical protein
MDASPNFITASLDHDQTRFMQQRLYKPSILLLNNQSRGKISTSQ